MTNAENLYEEIVSVGTAEVNTIAAEVTRAVEENVSLAEIEFLLRRLILKPCVRIYEILIRRLGKGYRGSKVVCECGGCAQFKDYRKTWLDTIVGSLRLEKAYYYCGECGSGFYPLDEVLQVEKGKSLALRRLISLAGIQDSFESASRLLEELSGIRVSDNTVQRVAGDTGAEVMDSESAQDEKLVGHIWSAEDSRRMYISVDGTTAPMRGYWKEFKVAAIYGEGGENKRYYTGLQESGEFMLGLRKQALAKGLGYASKVIALGDGQPWIWKQFGINFPMATQVLDFWHLTENVWKCAHALFGEGSKKACRWAEQGKRAALERGGTALLARLQRVRKRRKRKRDQEALDALISYVSENEGRTNYPLYRILGIEIGSGPIEAACKTVIGCRLKRAGMRWTERGAEKIAKLRAIHLSGLWDAFWGFTATAA